MPCEGGVAEGRGPLEVVPLGHGQYRVAEGSRQRLAYAAGPPEARWVFLDGRVYIIDTGAYVASGSSRTEGAYAASGSSRTGDTYVASGFSRTRGAAGGRPEDDELALAAPMPATVASIQVTAGQIVETGDLLVVLEAMKMELPIRAPRRGRVVAVACRRGELVQPGVPLVELA
jgi:biotin carboxyl carrier protein